jgi:hypothetical protein
MRKILSLAVVATSLLLLAPQTTMAQVNTNGPPVPELINIELDGAIFTHQTQNAEVVNTSCSVTGTFGSFYRIKYYIEADGDQSNLTYVGSKDIQFAANELRRDNVVKSFLYPDMPWAYFYWQVRMDLEDGSGNVLSSHGPFYVVRDDLRD